MSGIAVCSSVLNVLRVVLLRTKVLRLHVYLQRPYGLRSHLRGKNVMINRRRRILSKRYQL